MAFKSVQWKEIDGEKWFRFDKNRDYWRYFYSNLLTTIFIILLIAMMVYAYFSVEAIKTTPFIYGAQKNFKRTGESLTCQCIQGDVNAIPQKKFYFNETNIWVDKKPEIITKKIEDLNLSEFQNIFIQDNEEKND